MAAVNLAIWLPSFGWTVYAFGGPEGVGWCHTSTKPTISRCLVRHLICFDTEGCGQSTIIDPLVLLTSVKREGVKRHCSGCTLASPAARDATFGSVYSSAGKIGSQGAKRLADALARNTGITALNLSGALPVFTSRLLCFVDKDFRVYILGSFANSLDCFDL